MNINHIAYPLIGVALFMAGYSTHSFLHTCPVPAPQVVTEYKDRVVTEVVYVQKEQDEKTDVDIKINKPELYVKVNDKDFTIHKADDERYIFDKNKLSFTQASRSDINIDVPVVDKTRRYTLGVGISKDGMVGLLSFPINRQKYVGGWVAGSGHYQMAGLSVMF